MPGPRATIVVNPAAGRGRSRVVAGDLQERLATLGVPTDIVQPAAGRTRQAVRERLAEGCLRHRAVRHPQ